MPLHHHSLIAWQRADDLFIHVYELSQQHFPREELFGLTSQLRRAAYSVPANIVEGFARESARERLRFLEIAAGSLAEVGYCLHAAKRLGFLKESTYCASETEVKRASAPLHGLLRQYRDRTQRGRTTRRE
jgi:four helix bundle protein